MDFSGMILMLFSGDGYGFFWGGGSQLRFHLGLRATLLPMFAASFRPIFERHDRQNHQSLKICAIFFWTHNGTESPPLPHLKNINPRANFFILPFLTNMQVIQWIQIDFYLHR